MNWTATRPTRPGFYWYRQFRFSHHGRAQPMQLRADGKGALHSNTGKFSFAYPMTHCFWDGSLWFGPIWE